MAKKVDGVVLRNGVNTPLDENKTYGKIVKPKGWVGPDLKSILDKAERVA